MFRQCVDLVRSKGFKATILQCSCTVVANFGVYNSSCSINVDHGVISLGNDDHKKYVSNKNNVTICTISATTNVVLDQIEVRTIFII